jgi:menaquinone-dependent protoporphyrinogen oxidase
MRVLITYGSSRGGTEGLAQTVADGLRAEDIEVDVLPPDRVRLLDSYDAVIVGGALYASRWHRAARRFVQRHARELRERPVYLFSSGPLDESAAQDDIPPVKAVKALMERTGARGHITFGGRLSADAAGFPASAMAKTNAGDWRDATRVRRWARTIAAQLRSDVRQSVWPVGDADVAEADMKGNRQQRVLVGVDGSAASLAALRWAADEARLRRSSLRIVGAWDPATHAASYADVVGPATSVEREITARDAFSAAIRVVFGPQLPDRVTAELAEGAPERILLARSGDAGLLVLGATSRPWPDGWFAGPVIRACLAHASCPVVVIRSDAGTSGPASQDLPSSDLALASCRSGEERRLPATAPRVSTI